MEAKLSYYLILLVYIFLWSCQLVACHLTHSAKRLIILTDSYVNLYKILDVSLGILHLSMQAKREPGKLSKTKDTLTSRLLQQECSFHFKRLPLLGSFVNGLFLAALLMSAAIEGIQTCFHTSHAQADGERSILLEHPLTYPLTLVGFALVGVAMQWSTGRAHEMRAQEIGSDSLLDINGPHTGRRHLSELDAGKLSQLPAGERNLEPTRRAQSLRLGQSHSASTSRKFVLQAARHRSLECVPTQTDEGSSVSLRSLKFNSEFELSASPRSPDPAESSEQLEFAPVSCDLWQIIRFSVSPTSLVACALIVYFINEEIVTEIADATLAVLVVILLFLASYPPMKKAGMILLQTAPDDVDIDKLRAKLLASSNKIIEVEELHVWSLTPRSNRVATCHLVVDKNQISDEGQLSSLLDKVRGPFLRHNIRCLTIEPKLLDPAKADG